MKPSGVQLIRPMVPPGRHDADQLVGARLVVRGEHDADAGQHGVERAVVERERLGVGLPPVERDPGGLGVPATRLEQLGGEVAGDDAGTGLRRRDGDVAGARRDVEDAVPGPDAGWPRRGAARGSG